MTLRLLNRRCGPLSEATTDQILVLPLEQLEALADALLDFQGSADLTSWLAANSWSPNRQSPYSVQAVQVLGGAVGTTSDVEQRIHRWGSRLAHELQP